MKAQLSFHGEGRRFRLDRFGFFFLIMFLRISLINGQKCGVGTNFRSIRRDQTIFPISSSLLLVGDALKGLFEFLLLGVRECCGHEDIEFNLEVALGTGFGVGHASAS